MRPAPDLPPASFTYLPIETPPPGEVTRVAEGVHWIRFPLPLDLDHINLWLIEHAGGFVLVDTGLSSSAGRAAWERLEREVLASRPLRLIVVTHLHADHAGLAAWLQDRHQVPVWTSRDTERQIAQLFTPLSEAQLGERTAFLRSHGLSEPGEFGPSLSGDRYRTVVSGVPQIAHRPEDGEEVAWESGTWRWLATGGHAAGHLCLVEPACGVLITGDQVLPAISPNVSLTGWGLDANPLDSYLRSLERLRSLDPATLVLPSHGRPFTGLRERALELATHHEQRLERLLEACREPSTAVECLKVLYRRSLGGFHLFLALGEAVAHLEYLALAGSLSRLTDERGLIRYVRRGLHSGNPG